MLTTFQGWSRPLNIQYRYKACVSQPQNSRLNAIMKRSTLGSITNKIRHLSSSLIKVMKTVWRWW